MDSVLAMLVITVGGALLLRLVQRAINHDQAGDGVVRLEAEMAEPIGLGIGGGLALVGALAFLLSMAATGSERMGWALVFAAPPLLLGLWLLRAWRRTRLQLGPRGLSGVLMGKPVDLAWGDVRRVGFSEPHRAWVVEAGDETLELYVLLSGQQTLAHYLLQQRRADVDAETRAKLEATVRGQPPPFYA